MIITNIILNFIKSKYFLLFIIVSAIVIYIGILNIKLNNKYNEINKLNNEIISLKETNLLLNKDINFKQKQLSILETFTNSDEAIKNIQYKKLSDNNINALNAIINDYYKTLKFK
ncbi:hypothetical protein [Brachyspira sp.]|uniref:hypothetical protein n=1 Tax=Brachyspira sp. TaxID=1977261 RepID=UPI002605CB79|nr:hypothetical protein [Brachyspira sp.]